MPGYLATIRGGGTGKAKGPWGHRKPGTAHCSMVSPFVSVVVWCEQEFWECCATVPLSLAGHHAQIFHKGRKSDPLGRTWTENLWLRRFHQGTKAIVRFQLKVMQLSMFSHIILWLWWFTQILCKKKKNDTERTAYRSLWYIATCITEGERFISLNLKFRRAFKNILLGRCCPLFPPRG